MAQQMSVICVLDWTDALAASTTEHEANSSHPRSHQPVKSRACRYFTKTGILYSFLRLHLAKYFHWKSSDVCVHEHAELCRAAGMNPVISALNVQQQQLCLAF